MAQGSQKDRAENLKDDTTSVPTQVKEITYEFNNKNKYPQEEWPHCNYRLFSSYLIWSTVNEVFQVISIDCDPDMQPCLFNII